jgi:hypothetical protein
MAALEDEPVVRVDREQEPVQVRRGDRAVELVDEP